MILLLETNHVDRIDMMKRDVDKAAGGMTRSRMELTDRWDARCSLETTAIRLACAHVSTADLDQLRHLLEDRTQAAHRNDNNKVCEIDRQFHARIIGLAGNPFIDHLIRAYHLLDLPDSRDNSAPVVEHYLQIIDALERRDAEQAESSLLALLHAAKQQHLNFPG